MDLKQVLITGSSGCLGTALMRLLPEQGMEGRSYDLSNGDDIFDADNLYQALQPVDACIHLAAQADLEKAKQDTTDTFRINVEGTVSVAETCARTNTKLLFCSSVCVYGNNKHSRQTEGSPTAPAETYSKTKTEAEQRLSAIEQLDYRIIRPSVFYGRGMRASLATQKFIDACLEGRTIQVHGDGKHTRCYTHVNDVASAFALVLEKWPREVVFNVASDEVISVLELIDIVGYVTGTQPKFEHVADRHGQIYQSNIGCGRLKSYGWQPGYPSVKAGLLDYLKKDGN